MVASSKLGYQATSKEDYLCAHANLVAAITATVSKMLETFLTTIIYASMTGIILGAIAGVYTSIRDWNKEPRNHCCDCRCSDK